MQKITQRVIQAALDGGASFADVRVVDSTATAIGVEDGRTDRVSSARSKGAGIRVLLDGAWGFAPTNQPDEKDMLKSVADALEMAKAAREYVTDPGMVATVEPVVGEANKPLPALPETFTMQDRVRGAVALETAARSVNPLKTANTIANYTELSGEMFLANSFGTFLHYDMAGAYLSVALVASDGKVRQNCRDNRTGRSGYELLHGTDLEAMGTKVATKAIGLLDAERAPAGTFDVIIDPHICGLLVHEAFGHNSEADAVWIGDSILDGKIGEKVAADTVTIIDDPTLPNLNGSFTYDHEGVPAQKHIIVENGILKGYLHSLETAARYGVAPNGAARGDGADNYPIVRMSNTYIAPGSSTLQEMMTSLDNGLYLTGGYWGYVFTAQGQFTCNVEHAYAVKNGQLATHYRNVCISGRTLETLQHVTAVGNDLAFELGGMCGKNGQSMRVDAGGPHMLIRDVVVGGQGA